MRIKIFLLNLLVVGFWTTTGLAASADPVQLEPTLLLKLSEAGGPTLAIVLAMHWLRESHQRRLQDSQHYAEALAALKEEHRQELQRLRSTNQRNSRSRKEVTPDE